MTDDEWYGEVFKTGTMQDVMDLKSILIKEGDFLLAAACDGRLKELRIKNSDC
ncbi:hypothetical protein Phi13:2_gp093 [Cellulophaga phage phi13:2]|uniref:Uncharacterized protein n=4 Tax=Pachyviridae TaxID=2946166 RepID=S0A1D7_9CAUD|nr:hypothetical protein Phi19:3_gp098 [Cellulophaga phage phi19:3]YP_008241132.1 hypothetical protein Phi46:3_gp089 [Cellulophaga phage phi46:3]YP_008241286.1 hypothetical protein Phi18:3_gp093 [Cellulophaga phage phi18:3]YP_008242118.1 hypothetical protein Phi13:2_gp093 [Cellulophaga phage phi13:2]AGO47502.1 hypothetical protein Phi19:3_gp098 [Cellulophaga phage phi19:3]AGO48605.1 hypothetical protein Phi18:3_gp093 [Cellulophaga phage phi18:3]AGO48833.1 hypothetical protein Phi46:3_gp089 [Ce